MLEPRVMRVLVALASAGGKVLSRDDLIALCWDGQIVGDNAINRVISRLRQILALLASNTVRLETITKVGFRLIAEADPATGDRPPAPTSPVADPVPAVNRRWLIGAGLGAVVATGAIGWHLTSSRSPDPMAVKLVERGNSVMKSARIGSTPEAIRLYTQAVKLDPTYGDGWGALASSYRHALDGYGKGERLSYPQMVASAADRALALDPAQPDALVAKASIYPEYQNWLTQEKDLRALVRRFPDHWYANARMGILLREVGRFEEALQFSARVVQIDRQLAPAWAGLIRTLTLAGRFHEADAAFDESTFRSSPHPAIWFNRYSTLIESQRFGEAGAFARDMRTMPEEFPPRIGETHARMADTLAQRDKAGIARSLAYIKDNLRDPGYVDRAAPLLALLGDTSAALQAFSAYLFGGSIAGHTYPAPGRLDTRSTQSLFAPSLFSSRGESLFVTILRRSGLEDYWQRSGSQPDFRRN